MSLSVKAMTCKCDCVSIRVSVHVNVIVNLHSSLRFCGYDSVSM